MKVTVDGISKSYKNNEININVLSDLSIDLADRKIVSFVGSNGSGKSTLLNIIAGLIKPDKGTVFFSKEDFSISYVWQNYSESLFPWLNVFDNIKLGIGSDISNSQKVISEALDFFNVSIPLEKFPYQLSGGQKQIVTFIRAVVNEPDILLLDEPFSALDRKNKYSLVDNIQKYHAKHRPIILLVTHDMDDAILMGDSLVILDGKQKGNKYQIDINLPRPRGLTETTQSNFIEIRNQVINYFSKMLYVEG